ncbi:MAG: hypothetical protein U0736_20075 [Gemmataceae bacterium]
MFDRNIALATAAVAVFLSIEFSVLIGVFLSFFFFVPRVSRLRVTELVVSKERVVRERGPGDERCTRLAILSLEGELFFGTAPELDAVLAELAGRVERGVRVIVLRLKRTRNPDMVCLERMQHFLHDMQDRKVIVLLCGVRQDFAQRSTGSVSTTGCHPTACSWRRRPGERRTVTTPSGWTPPRPCRRRSAPSNAPTRSSAATSARAARANRTCSSIAAGTT